MTMTVKGGTLVSPAGRARRDVFCRDGRIEAVVPPGSAPDGDIVVDATGLYVLPGVIDPHVHSRDPGLTYKEDFSHSTRSAAAGGITTILEMPNSIPPVTDASSFETRASGLLGHAHVDFGLWTLALDIDSAVAFDELQRSGAVGAKLFWGYAFDRRSGALVYDPLGIPAEHLHQPATAGDVWRLLQAAAEARFLIGVHCEDRSILDAAASMYGTPKDYPALLRHRPPEAESAAIALLIELTRSTRASVHVLHVSTTQGANLIRRARADGIDITAETCPHYLTLTADDNREIGSAMKVFPPIRTADDRDALWAGLEDGAIVSIGSDHAPHSKAERGMPFEHQPAGVVGVETMLQVLLDAVIRGRLSLERLVWVLSEGTARRYGLYPRKGAIAPGSDADMVVIDLERPWVIENAKLHSKNPVSPWHGRRGHGYPVQTILRGRIVAESGQPVGAPTGCLVRRPSVASDSLSPTDNDVA